MTPEELIKEEKELEEDKSIYPPFLVEEFRKGRAEKRLEKKTGKRTPYNPKNITDFLQVIRTIWVISNKEYQKRFWVRQEPPMLYGDNYMETMETFLGDAEGVLDTSDYAVEMTPKQREMLEKFYNMMEDYEADPDSADDPGYGVNDAEIIEDPKFAKCREYAKLVYEELSGDDLDEWEAQRQKR